jgi:hypothetical protein
MNERVVSGMKSEIIILEIRKNNNKHDEKKCANHCTRHETIYPKKSEIFFSGKLKICSHAAIFVSYSQINVK